MIARPSRRIAGLLGLSLTTVGIAALLQGSADAHTTKPRNAPLRVEYGNIDASTLQKGTRNASSFARDGGFVKRYLDSQARLGRRIDERSIKLATVPNPVQRGTDLTIAWDGTRMPVNVSLGKVSGDTGGKLGVGVTFDETRGGPAAAESASGTGYDSAVETKNVNKISNNCATVKLFHPWWMPSDHSVIAGCQFGS
ncbi:hypothetical protein [Actinomadura roseirufa]|uniref:hypothetical protein n=1 Tax=Actinomadura roseirufa TaxID=2094049 RepID=UPI0010414F19|nr:hypothetical protein [Actinomadura roseirufa]